MRAATYTQGGGFALSDRPEPRINADEILVRVMASSICGTDMRIIGNGHRKLKEGQCLVLGHEFAGLIERVGEQVEGLRAGQRVGIAPNIGCGRCEMCAKGLANLCPDYTAFGITFDGAHAPLVRVPKAAIAQGNVILLPEALAWEEASLIEPFSCVVNGMQNAGLGLGDEVAIFGAGPIGLMHMLLAQVGGASRIMMIDTNGGRLAYARQLCPAVITIDASREDVKGAVLEASDGHGADLIVTACSVAQVQAQALELLAPQGRVSLFGGLAKDSTGVLMNTNLIHYKNLLVTGMTGGSLMDYRTALKLIASGRVPVRPIISECVPAAHMARAFELARTGQAMKIVIVYHD